METYPCDRCGEDTGTLYATGDSQLLCQDCCDDENAEVIDIIPNQERPDYE